ncbi:MAG: hypothetical protein A2V66_03545 [Ignavibacteria bacterium RBG_13_36_8]|nr:MAG: hypothetical protein A2V66_03545 [Ignavibacteria bacterium RBG_13_36_8]
MGIEYNMKRQCWSKKDIEKLIKLYPNTLTSKIAKRFGISISHTYQKAYSLGLHKSQEFIKALGKKYSRHPHAVAQRFKKGCISWNKGKKGTHFSPATEFKKGHKPANTLVDDAITIRTDHKDCNKRKYKWIRLSEGKWIPLHQYLWKNKYGKVPKGHVIAFKNGNSFDCRLGNLMLITMAQNARRNYNPIKSGLSHRKMRHEFKDLENDNYIAATLSLKDKSLRKKIKKNKTLLDLQRARLRLNREIKYATANT